MWSQQAGKTTSNHPMMRKITFSCQFSPGSLFSLCIHHSQFTYIFRVQFKLFIFAIDMPLSIWHEFLLCNLGPLLFCQIHKNHQKYNKITNF
jgi:hypothetical protein